MMSEIAVRDNNAPESQRINGSFNNRSITKSQAEGTEEKQREGVAAVIDTSIKTDKTETPASVEVEYIETEDLQDVEDLYNVHRTLLSRLSSRNWVSVCEALNNVRQLCIFHKEALANMRDEVVYFVWKSLQSPRSAVCKTGIMTAADLFKEYKDDIIDSLDPIILQLLLKSSQDKKFVREAAERALIALTSWISPTLLLPKLIPFVKLINPRTRAKASMCISRSVSRLGVDGIEAFGMDKLIEIGASQLKDRLPESRNAARALLLELQSAYEKSHIPESTADPEQPVKASWEEYCQSKLSPLSAQAVLRVTR